jgi:hypothetical protein
MDAPFLQLLLERLSLPGPAKMLVSEFLREPHPAAKLIKDLVFDRSQYGLFVSGAAVRWVDYSTDRPTYITRDELDEDFYAIMLDYDPDSGESNHVIKEDDEMWCQRWLVESM